MSMTSTKSHLPLAAVSLFLAAHIVVPLVWGDVYPFTSAPMFRDTPQRYCNYHVFAPDGAELPQEGWLVQRVYDGNPVGYGVGVKPPAVLEQKFGVVHAEREVREHIGKQFFSDPTANHFHSYVEVVQEIFGPVDGGNIGSVGIRRSTIAKPSPLELARGSRPTSFENRPDVESGR